MTYIESFVLAGSGQTTQAPSSLTSTRKLKLTWASSNTARLLAQKLIDEDTFREIYQYRLSNLIANDWVRVEKVCRRSEGWKRFISLLKRMNVEYTC
jgi:hypothetical protein